MTQNSFIVYGKIECPVCETTKSILNSKQVKFVYKSVPEDLSAKDFSIVMEAFGIFPRSFPQVVKIEEETNVAKYIGGLQETIKDLQK